MTRNKQDDLTSLMKRNGIDEIYLQAEKVDNKISSILSEISGSYIGYSKSYDAIARSLLLEIIGDEKINSVIHSVRYRIKSIDSLKTKIVKKKAVLSKDVSDDYEKEKYRWLDANNYYKILTDLIGFRVIVRYREQCLDVHNWIFKKYYKGDEYYIRNHIEDYKPTLPFPVMVEKPKIYYRNKQERAFYEQVGRDFYELIESDEGYNSMHYIINVDGKYIEIQVRTIFDEAWSECTHDIIYKNRDKKLKEELENLSTCLAQQTIAAETIVNLMYEKVNKSSKMYGTIDGMTNLTSIKIDNADVIKNATIKDLNIEKRIDNVFKSDTNEFNGNFDDLI